MRSIVERIVLLIGCSSFVSELERGFSCWMDSDMSHGALAVHTAGIVC